MEDIAKGAFWLAVGVVIAASILADAYKERGKEREKQETIRTAMRLEAEGKLTPETLAYMRERDAAEMARAREEAQWTSRSGALRGLLAFIVGFVSFLFGLAVGAVIMRATQDGATAGIAMLIVWVIGGLLVFATLRGAKKQKAPEKAPPPGA